MNMPKSTRCWMSCLMLAQRSWLITMLVAILWVARVVRRKYCTVFSYPWQPTVLLLQTGLHYLLLHMCSPGRSYFVPTSMRWREDPAEMLCSECSCRLSHPCLFSAAYSTSAHLEPVVFLFPGGVEIILLWRFHSDQALSFLYIHPALSKKKERW